MKKTKKFIALGISLVFALTLCVGTVAAAGFQGKDTNNDSVKIAFISMSTAGVTNVQYETAFAEVLAAYEDNVTFNYFDGEYNPTTQINLIQDCITQEYDAIIIEPTDGQALASATLEAEEAGIPVISINPGIECVHSGHVQGYDYAAGEQGAQYLYDALGDGKKVVILDCPAAAKASTQMGTGFEDWVTANTDWEIVAHEYIDNFSLEIANTTMRDILTANPEIDAVYGAIDDLAIGAIQAIEAAGRSDDGILVWGSTGYYNAFEAIKDGTMYGTSWCDTYSEIEAAVGLTMWLVDTGITAANAGYERTPVINETMIPVTQDNVDQMLSLSRWEYTTPYSIENYK